MTSIEAQRFKQLRDLPNPKMVRWYKTKAHSIGGEFVGVVRHTKYWNGKQMAKIVFNRMKLPKRVPLMQVVPELTKPI